eukprot:6475766-Amphidinium_carterae.1
MFKRFNPSGLLDTPYEVDPTCHVQQVQPFKKGPHKIEPLEHVCGYAAIEQCERTMNVVGSNPTGTDNSNDNDNAGTTNDTNSTKNAKNARNTQNTAYYWKSRNSNNKNNL